MTDTAAPLRTAQASGLGAVERELAVLHRDMLRGTEEGRMVRLSVLTLVVACVDRAAADEAAEVVAEISAHHPSRALLIFADRDAPHGIEADLSLSCRIDGAREQICAETVRLRVGGDAALHLGSVVTPLLLPDVPVQLWVAGAARLEQALSPDSLSIVERVIVDSACWPAPLEPIAALGAVPPGRDGSPPVADLAWLRLRPWRELVARAADPAPRRARLRDPAAVTVRGAAAAGGGPSAEAWLLAGWLASRLDVGGRVDVTVDPGGDAPVTALLLETGEGAATLRIEVQHSPEGLSTSTHLDGEPVSARVVPDDPPRLAELVGAALQQLGGDPVHRAAMEAALSLQRRSRGGG